MRFFASRRSTSTKDCATLLESLTPVHVCLCATSLLWALRQYEKSGSKESLPDFNLRNAGGTLHTHEPGQI